MGPAVETQHLLGALIKNDTGVVGVLYEKVVD